MALVWDFARQLHAAATPGSTVSYFDMETQSLYIADNHIKTQVGLLDRGMWDTLVREPEVVVSDDGYSYLDIEHNFNGAVWGMAQHGSDVVLLMYMYMLNVSTWLDSGSWQLQPDNPIKAGTIVIKNADKRQFEDDAHTLFSPGSKLRFRYSFGDSDPEILGMFFIEDSPYSDTADSFSFRGRNRLGFSLSSQSFDERIHYTGTKTEVITQMLRDAGVISTAMLVQTDLTQVSFTFESSKNYFSGFSEATTLMDWYFDDLPDGTIVVGNAEFIKDNVAKTGIYSFNLGSDVISRSVSRQTDGVYSRVCVRRKNPVAGTVNLAIPTNPTVNDTITIGTKVYTFKASAVAEGDIAIGALMTDTQILIKAAINGTGAGQVCAAHPLVTCGEFGDNSAAITAIVKGEAVIETTETFTAVNNVFSAAALVGGLSPLSVYADVPYFEGWYVAPHRTFYQDVPDITDDATMGRIRDQLVEGMQYSGITETFEGNFRPWLQIGDVAIVTKNGVTRIAGIISDVKHTFGAGGFWTIFTVTSGGTISDPDNPATVATKYVNRLGGANRQRRLTDYLLQGSNTLYGTSTTGDTGAGGAAGAGGANGTNGTNGVDGSDGASAYQIWLAQGYTGTEQDYLNWLSNSSTIIGIVQLWPTGTAPANWMLCDGQAISRITYTDLFTLVGTTYGVGDGVTTFNLPTLTDPVSGVSYMIKVL